MPASLERERKLAGSADFEMPELDHVIDGVLAVPRPDQQLDAVYYDTTDLRLARSGITVRFRTGEGGAGKWTVKLPEGLAGPSMVRREIEVHAPGRVVPHEVASLVRGHVRSALLAPVGTIRTRRRLVELRDGGGVALAEVADDEVSVLEGRRVSLRFREIEVELLGAAGEDLLGAVVQRLTSAGAADADQTPKIVRALGPRALEPPEACPSALDPHRATLSDVVGAAITAAWARLLEHDPWVRLGGDDENVHQARVAVRRLRSDLRTFQSVLDTEGVGRLGEDLRWIGGELGVVRDADVLLARLRRQGALLPAADLPAVAGLLGRLEDERQAGRARLIAALDGDRYLALLDALAAGAADPPVDVEADAPARKALPEIVRRPWKHLHKAVDGLGDHPDDPALHQVRIRAKRARYAAEAAASVLGKPASRLAKAVTRVQALLGDLQDAVVAEAWLRRVAAEGSSAEALAAGQLLVLQRDAMAAARQEWRRQWDEVAAKKLRSWLA